MTITKKNNLNFNKLNIIGIILNNLFKYLPSLSPSIKPSSTESQCTKVLINMFKQSFSFWMSHSLHLLVEI
jgi:hypothetical protein